LLSRPVVAFEQAPTVANQTAALAALTSIQSVTSLLTPSGWKEGAELPELRKRVTAAVLKRGESVAGNDPDSALKDYEAALSLGASASESASLKTKLVTALAARCRQSLGSQDYAKASADYPPPSQRNSSRVSTCLREVTILAPRKNLLAVMMRQRYREPSHVNRL